MASLVKKVSRGHEYYQIVQSKRIDGKPHAIVVEHLGSIQHIKDVFDSQFHPDVEVKTYSHGLVSALLAISERLGVVGILNRHCQSARPYFASQPIRNGLTVGGTLLLAAIGRVCNPTSKRGWSEWACGTSLPHLLSHDLSGLDSQHFWDMMDSFPADQIDSAYEEILKSVKAEYGLSPDTVLYDATNFFTYIDSCNARCTIARRGHNKQKRNDLRQVGLALSVSRGDMVPVCFDIYEGSLNDAREFSAVLDRLVPRMECIGVPPSLLTIVFDRGNNSKANLAQLATAGCHYVGALSPCHHKELMDKVYGSQPSETVQLGGLALPAHRIKKEIWGADRTVVVFRSLGLQKGVENELGRQIGKVRQAIDAENARLANPKCRKYTPSEMAERLNRMTDRKGLMPGMCRWKIAEQDGCSPRVELDIDDELYDQEVEKAGYRIIMTDQHEWKTVDIIKTYFGQSDVEHSFKNLKNPYHLAVRPEFHWTDQKIKVHIFTCIIGYLLVALIWKRLKGEIAFTGCVDHALDILNRVRIAACTCKSSVQGRVSLIWKLERIPLEDLAVLKALGIADYHMQTRNHDDFFNYDK